MKETKERGAYTNKRKVGKKNMTWCPMTKSDCKKECAWFAQGGCSVARLHDISDSLDEIQDRLTELDETITNKDFT